jgi:Flp pilus assembly protein TadD
LGNPKEPDTLVLSAVVCEGLGRLGEAEAFYAQAIAVKPWDAVARFNLGRLLWRRGERAAAAEHWRQFLFYRPDDPSAADVRRLLGSP